MAPYQGSRELNTLPSGTFFPSWELRCSEGTSISDLSIYFYGTPLLVQYRTPYYYTYLYMKKYSIGIVGYGDFTKVMLEYLAPYADIVVSSRQPQDREPGFGARFGTVEEVLSQAIIIPSIPAQFIKGFLTENFAYINPMAIFIDVCSVKVHPLQVLEAVLPATCQIIGTHPMFGPASILKNNGIVGLPCALCPVRCEGKTLSELTHLLSDVLKLDVIRISPGQHDREMAYVQGLSHYIGRVMDGMRIPDSRLKTAAYENLLEMKRIQGGDSWELFASIMHENPYAVEVHALFEQACKDLNQKIEL